jgi:hypothetical protein
MRHAAVLLSFLVSLAGGLAPDAHADEGMWTYNNFPKDKLKQRYGISVDDRWLEHLRLSSARLAQGCSASFVSADGLVMTNHHCAHSCVQELSTAANDLVQKGFYAAGAADEPKCPELEVNQLLEITDVTERVRKATAGLSETRYNEAEKAELSRIEKECTSGADVRCDVVTLYRGGEYDLYKYRRFQDVRLVFVPELATAFFGGDPDNFNFPRYDLDVAFVRVWQGDKPARMDHYLRWSAAGPKDGDVTFVSGHPGGTDRQLTVAQLEYQRDVALPDRLLRLAELRGLLTEYQRRGPEQRRTANHLLFGVENGFKALKGRQAALLDARFFATLVAQERQLREAVAKDPALQKEYGGVWDALAKAQETSRALRKRYNMIELGQGFSGDLFSHARTLVRAAEERNKPLEKRFREYRDSALPALTQRLFSTAPIYDELETTLLAFSLTKLREELGADDPFVRKVLGKESPDELAARLVKNTRLKDPAARKALWEGGSKAIAESDVAMIHLARLIDGDARAIRKRFEDEVEAPVKKNTELLAKARFAVLGRSSYPDATFTLRLNYGRVAGWEEDGKKVPPFATMGGAFDRATGRPPFDLPPSWLAARSKIDLKTPLDFASTNDIIGGNSGSPVVNKNAELVGLIFDGNIHSLGGDFGYDEAKNRSVAVDSAAILEALSKIYKAERLVRELRPRPEPAASPGPAAKRAAP